MKLSAAELDSITALLTRIYLDIRSIEEEYQLLAGEHDFRPRIEHFHDAVRAYSSNDPQARASGGRLSVEWLAYDLSCLRYLHDKPLSPFKPHGETLSASVVVMPAEQGLMVRAKRPDRQVRARLAELYQHYAVLFAALLKSSADGDLHARTDHLQQDVQDIAAIIQQLEGLLQGKGSMQSLGAAVQHLEEDALRELLTLFLQQQRHKQKSEVKKLIASLKKYATDKEKTIQLIEKAHMNYAMAQFGIYEGSKELIKKMAVQGMNVVGKFVEASIAETRREMGR